jgi:hypothetical protein
VDDGVWLSTAKKCNCCMKFKAFDLACGRVTAEASLTSKSHLKVLSGLETASRQRDCVVGNDVRRAPVSVSLSGACPVGDYELGSRKVKPCVQLHPDSVAMFPVTLRGDAGSI